MTRDREIPRHALGRWTAKLAAVALLLIAAEVTSFSSDVSAKEAPAMKPTVVLVHGAFAESSSWNGVVSRLLGKGYPVVAAANPLRSVKGDSAYVASVLASIQGPIILVGHSYGGSVISNAAHGNGHVKALVFVAGLAPDVGESADELVGKFPGSTLGPTLAPPIPLADGGKDLFIQADKFPLQFAADVPVAEARRMAATQRPIVEAAFHEKSDAAAWKSIPSWFIFGKLDKNIPEAVHEFMARRAQAKKIVAVGGASHVVMISHPDAVAAMIVEAAAGTAAARQSR